MINLHLPRSTRTVADLQTYKVSQGYVLQANKSPRHAKEIMPEEIKMLLQLD